MEWIENSRGHYKSKFDGEVVIGRFDKPGLESKYIFKFRKNSSYKIVRDSEYLIVARDNDKIYFKESDELRGFKLGPCGIDSARAIKVKCKQLGLDESALGEYNLEYDSELKLHYISLYRKLEKQLSWEGKK